MIKRIALASLAVVGLSSAALAADMRMPVKAPPPMPAPIFTWTGFYIGGFVGGAFADKDAVSTEPQACAGAACVFLFTQPGGIVSNNAYDLDSSFIGGGTVGYNWQMPGSQWVIGIEGEVGYMDLNGSVRDINAAPPPALAGFDSTKMGELYGVIAGRLGFTWDRVLIYGKGGVAFVEKSYTYAASVPPQTAILSRDDTQVTWAAGGGIEWAVTNNWSIKGEYLYIDTKEDYDGAGVGVGGFINGAALVNRHSDPGIHTGKFGVNYRF
ncbi:outer membrane beta-barrel protein [Bradyrhizobium sp. LHD-71]|uniref:outer membrane protein n=1 Tax=Bradyrhizobium sp. LHD-71 TaxID=3072141 RepID=UPI00281085C4|nr:outer membrane beta-barrel protein [Bradyrhizobium sp. LHD-71]MDQ8728526.1 outer membrane beta-barrel protein [Bradyrhizobium sp. LHD-71]